MNAAAAVLATAAAVMFGFGPAFCLALVVSERRDRKADEKRRAEQGREIDTEWFALLAGAEVDEGSPIYDRMVCEHIEREEGWV